MYNLWHNLQLVEGGQYLVVEEISMLKVKREKNQIILKQ